MLQLQFESALKSPLKELWEEFSPNLNEGKMESRGEAYVLFSKALKFSNLVKSEGVRELWFNLLEQGSFSLTQKEKEPIIYRFNTIIELLKSGKEAFEIDLVEFDASNDDVLSVSDAISSIALDSLGTSPGSECFQKIISSPNTLCLLAKTKETFIACAYGSYLETSQVKFFHFNFLGRKIEYPSVHILDKLQGEQERIRNKFPHIQYLTLCVDITNSHMIPFYKGLGFEEIETTEAVEGNPPKCFCAKKVDQNFDMKAPTYSEYKEALKSSREK